MISKVNIFKLSALLISHPDRYLVHYIMDGLSKGFGIGFKGISSVTRPRNLLSSHVNKAKISEAIDKELVLGHTSGPFLSPPFDNLHCSPIGAVIKKDRSCRLVMDLSQPRGSSINDYISKEEFSVKYTHFDEATALVRLAGRSSLLSKVDIRHAFRLLPVRPQDWKLLGYMWERCYFIDTRLPFGLRSSPGIFNHFAGLICWVLQNKYGLHSLVHYADDFFLVSNNNGVVAQKDLSCLCEAFDELSIPLAEEKIIGPSHIITYLGIEINSTLLTVPKDKYDELMSLLPSWLGKKSCSKRQLLSLIGKLSFVCKVVRPGRIFLRRLINLSMSVKKLNHYININAQTREDIKWWVEFLPSWNQTSLIPETFEVTSTDLKLFTDASSVGFGAIYAKSWIQGRWDESANEYSIDFKELFAIVAAVMTWGSQWEGKRIVFFTDNLPITQIWHSGTSRSSDIMVLVRKLFLSAAQFGFSVSLKHILGIHNPIADALSRFQVLKFKQLAPDAEVISTQLPLAVAELLLIIPHLR